MVLDIIPDEEDKPIEEWNWPKLIGTRAQPELISVIRLASGTVPMLRLVPTPDVENP